MLSSASSGDRQEALIAELVSVLRRGGLDVSDGQLADILWLAMQMGGTAAEPETMEATVEREPLPVREPMPGTPEPRKPPRPPPAARYVPLDVRSEPHTTAHSEDAKREKEPPPASRLGSAFTAFRSPGASILPNALAL